MNNFANTQAKSPINLTFGNSLLNKDAKSNNSLPDEFPGVVSLVLFSVLTATTHCLVRRILQQPGKNVSPGATG